MIVFWDVVPRSRKYTAVSEVLTASASKAQYPIRQTVICILVAVKNLRSYLLEYSW